MKLMARFLHNKSAMGRFICHIGPPKTATTAIQSALQKISGGSVDYLGTFQPRNVNKSKGIYSNLMTLVESQPNRYAIYRNTRKIDNALKFGIDLILSEEMLLVSQHGAGFEQKLQRLGQVINRYPSVIIISLREPVAALKSFYAEIYFRQQVQPRISFEEFLTSNQARVFDYLYLLETLRKYGFDNVRFVSIQRGQNEIKLADFTGHQEHDQLLQLSNANQTEAIFREQVDALEVPEHLALHLRKGYAHALDLV